MTLNWIQAQQMAIPGKAMASFARVLDSIADQ